MTESFENLTPSMRQYMEIKNAHKDYLLFYRMGDFYELFFEDAVIASEALDLVLTARNKNKGENNIPMCGVPFHAYENYLARLIHQGYKVAICEQMETPEEAKKRGSNALVKRDIVRLVTPGTLTEDTLLNAKENNFLLTVIKVANTLGFAWADLSTGDFYTKALESDPQSFGSDIYDVLSVIDPKEIIVSDQMLQNKSIFDVLNLYQDRRTILPQNRFNSVNAQRLIEKVFNVKTLEAFGNFSKAEISAAGVTLDYIETTQIGKLPCLKRPIQYNSTQTMEIDVATRHNLELMSSVNGEKKNSLIGVIDRTVSALGSRLLASRLRNPSINLKEINNRLDMVEFFIGATEIRQDLRELLKQISDIERNISRLSLGRAGPKEVMNFGTSLSFIPKIKNLLHNYGKYTTLIEELPHPLLEVLENMADLTHLVDLIHSALEDDKELPNLTREGGFIKKGYSAELDELRNIKDNSEVLISRMEETYAKELNISGIKIKSNSIIGYYIDIPNKFATDVLQNPKFIHRQTVLNSVRFTTAELNDLNLKLNTANERSVALELELFTELSQEILSHAQAILKTAESYAELDVCAALAELAVKENYCRPLVDDSLCFEIKDGRHPVVENALKRNNEGAFVCNNCCLNGTDNRIWLITGPNMAGKSTFLRQNALIVILAQIGSYVPCSSAHIGLVDKVFSRVGASDDLARGRSTFMVEMVETAAILNRSTNRSFVILDEIGRGTATYDGLSIAWAVVEHLHEVNACRALFATHYHELTALEKQLNALSLHCMKIKEFNGDVVFMHEVIEGMADRSYGIHVAKLAGLPKLVLRRAEQILKSLENAKSNKPLTSIEEELPLFSNCVQNMEPEEPSAIHQALEKLEPDNYTPREALDKLYELKALYLSKKS